MDSMSTVAYRSDRRLDSSTAGTLEVGSSMVSSTDANSNLERTRSPRHIQLIHRVLRQQGNQERPSESLANLSLAEPAKKPFFSCTDQNPKTDYGTCSDFKTDMPKGPLGHILA